MRLIPATLAFAAACLLIVACGGSDDSDSSPAAPTTPSSGGQSQASGGQFDPCSLLTTAEVSEALGAAVSQPERPREAQFGCRYTAPRGQALAVMTILVPITGNPSNARAGFESAKASVSGAQAVTGVGEEAFYLGDQLHVRGGGAYFVVGGDVSLEQARALAQKALAKLN